MDAIVFAGGSWHGLAAATGAADELRELARATGGPLPIVGVTGAIVNDVAAGRRLSGIMPDDALGRAAIRAARSGTFPLGARGAGRFTMLGSALGQAEPAGQGAAVRQIGSTRIAVFTVVNAGGFVVDRTGRIARCRSQHFGDPCSGMNDLLARRVQALADRSGDSASLSDVFAPTTNTTLTLVLTNQRMESAALQRLAVQVHTSMARAIQPFATAGDGDVLFAATTGEVDNSINTAFELGLVASELAWDAVLAALPPIEPIGPLTVVPEALRGTDDYMGDYEFGPGSRVRVKRVGGFLRVEPERAGIMYFPAATGLALIAVGADEFRLDGPRRDRLRFERTPSGRVTAIELNPGSWSVRAWRLPSAPPDAFDGPSSSWRARP